MRTDLFMQLTSKKHMKTLKQTVSMPTLTNFRRQFATLSLAVLLGVGMALAFPGIALAASPNHTPPRLLTNAPSVYIVKKGDTLWDISGRYLKQPWRWPEIWAVNRHVKNPHWIYPGDRLLICVINGRTVIGKDEGDGCLGIERRMNGDLNGTIRLQPQVRIEPLGTAIPLISLASIEHWLKRSRVVNLADIAGIPYVLGTRDNRVIAAAGQSVYVRGLGLTNGQQYGVYREGSDYIDVTTKENLGREMMQVATGVVTAINGEVATVELTKSFDGEVRRGDRVMLEDTTPLPATFAPTQPDQVKTGGRVIKTLDSISSAAKNSVVALDRGTADGAAAGQVFAVYQKGQVITDPKTREEIRLPSERVGLVMIFRAFNRISYAYVLESSLPIKADDEIRSPVGDLEDQL